jgi:hypothetical protein
MTKTPAFENSTKPEEFAALARPALHATAETAEKLRARV